MPGDTVGRVVVSAGGQELGQVPLVVAGVGRSDEGLSGTWWTRAAGSVFHALTAALEGDVDWSPGTYRADIYMDDKLKFAVQYLVQ